RQHHVGAAHSFALDQSYHNYPGQEPGWRNCERCQMLFNTTKIASSVCPLGGRHVEDIRAPLCSLPYNNPQSLGEYGWRQCRQCQGLFNTLGVNYGGYANSPCPAGGAHDGTGSLAYSPPVQGANHGVWNDSPPNMLRGGNSLWGNGGKGETSCFLLRATGDRAGARGVRLQVLPYTVGASSIAVKWFPETWVDFNYAGLPFNAEDGSFVWPFNTLSEGITAVTAGGNISIKSGSHRETGTFSKPATLRSYNGWATVGR
ncbi:MAG: hypothetical protein NT154_18685, partial [Verrucomicrobia bacterium]|nr:hypothetical protein [Verrucomicrobiota bacterium]